MSAELFRLAEDTLSESPSFTTPFDDSSPLDAMRASYELLTGETILGTWLNEESSETRVFIISTLGIRISRREEASHITFQFLPYSEVSGVSTKSGAQGMPDRICIRRKSGAETWLRATGSGEEDETSRMVSFLESILDLEIPDLYTLKHGAILSLDLQLFSHSKNSRSTPFWTGYRGQLRIPGGIIPLRLDSTLLLEKKRSVRPGDHFKCRAWIRGAEKLPRNLIPGDEIYLEEDKKRIGIATILESCHLNLGEEIEPFQILYDLQDKIHQSTPCWHCFQTVIEIRGEAIRSEGDFYAALRAYAQETHFQPQDLNSLWKWLGSDLAGPTLFLWTGIDQSAIHLNKKLVPILEVLHESRLADLRFRL